MRPLNLIAEEIKKDWEKVNYGAVPYLNAMHKLNNISDKFGLDRGDEIVRYFLSNARSWNGAVARRIKAELNEMIK